MDKLNFVKSNGVDHYIQRLYVHWDVNTLCQYKCTYCYARKQYKTEWGRLGDWNKQQYVIEELSKASLPVFLGLLGGEPTLHHHYGELIDSIIDRVIHHDDSRLYITTNGHRPTEWFKQQRDSNGKIYMLWSVHPEYVDEEQFKILYNNIVTMHDKGYKTKINLMLHPGRKFWNITKMMYGELNKLDYAILHPHFIYGGFDKDVKYNKDFYKEFKFLENQRVKEFVFTDDSQKAHIFSDYEIFSNNLNQFKGWKCWQNNYEIRYNNKISDQCFNRFARDIPVDFFKNIKAVEPKICPHNYCSCDGLMKINKERI